MYLYTDIDPARPLFEGYPEALIHKSDARFIDVIHSGVNEAFMGTLGIGILVPLGHADFYADGGSPSELTCSFMTLQYPCGHTLGVLLYEATISKCSFYGMRCSSIVDAQMGNCPDYDATFLLQGPLMAAAGFPISETTRGIFYLDTSQFTNCYHYQLSSYSFVYRFLSWFNPFSYSPKQLPVLGLLWG